MKSNVESRVQAFQQDLDKFSARWHQLKPRDIDEYKDRQSCLAAVRCQWDLPNAGKTVDVAVAAQLWSLTRAQLYEQCLPQSPVVVNLWVLVDH